jgi:hypothetical protein
MQKFFTNTIVLIATGFLDLAAIALPLQAKSEQAGKSCETAIANSKSRIEKGRDLLVTTDIADYSKIYPNHPNGRPLFVIIIVDGNAADSVMLSPVFQKAITSEIIKSCGSIGAVTFSRRETDWATTFGIMSDGTIQTFKCTDPPESAKYSWGQESCP